MKRRGGKLNDAHLTHDRSRLHAALDAVLDSAMAKDAQDVNLMTQRLDAEIKPCAVKGYEGKWTCRITRGGAFVKSTIWPTREKAEECARKHHARIAALDAVLDHGRARDREPSMAEEKAYDMGVADAKKGSAQNPNPDWSRALKSAYVSGYHAGLGHGRARDAGVLTDDIEFDFSQNAKTGSGKKTPASIAKAIKMMERKYGPEVAAALRARHT